MADRFKGQEDIIFRGGNYVEDAAKSEELSNIASRLEEMDLSAKKQYIKENMSVICDAILACSSVSVIENAVNAILKVDMDAEEKMSLAESLLKHHPFRASPVYKFTSRDPYRCQGTLMMVGRLLDLVLPLDSEKWVLVKRLDENPCWKHPRTDQPNRLELLPCKSKMIRYVVSQIKSLPVSLREATLEFMDKRSLADETVDPYAEVHNDDVCEMALCVLTRSKSKADDISSTHAATFKQIVEYSRRTHLQKCECEENGCYLDDNDDFYVVQMAAQSAVCNEDADSCPLGPSVNSDKTEIAIPRNDPTIENPSSKDETSSTPRVSSEKTVSGVTEITVDLGKIQENTDMSTTFNMENLDIQPVSIQESNQMDDLENSEKDNLYKEDDDVDAISGLEDDTKSMVGSELDDDAKSVVGSELEDDAKSVVGSELDDDAKSVVGSELDDDAKSVVGSELDDDAKSVVDSELEDDAKSVVDSELDDDAKSVVGSELDDDAKSVVDSELED